MSSYPPPSHDQPHYTPLYPASSEPSQLLDVVQHEQLQFSNINQSAYPKLDNVDRSFSPSSQSLAQELHNANLSESHQQQVHPSMEQSDLQQSAAGQVQVSADAEIQTLQTTPGQQQRPNRLRRACDSCSIRKVKCDESGPPCRACTALEIPCTFDRPSRRRGPPNRHAEAIKRRRLDGGAHPASPHLAGTPTPTPSSPTHAAQALAALSSHSAAHVSAESICALDTLELLIDDFFTYMYPLSPFPHEPSFREAWRRREDLSNKSFLALLAAMIGAFVASLPRKPRLHLKSQKREANTANHMNIVHRCQRVCTAARGPAYLESDVLNVYDAATSYYLALLAGYTASWRLSRLYLGECTTILRALDIHKEESHSQSRPGPLLTVGSHNLGEQVEQAEFRLDKITTEMGRRIHWAAILHSEPVEQVAQSLGGLAEPPTSSIEPYPPLPTEVDDFCIYPDQIESQPNGLLPLTAGFNAIIRIYASYKNAAVVKMDRVLDEGGGRSHQSEILSESLRRCRSVQGQLPPELALDLSSPQFGYGEDLSHGNNFPPPAPQPRFLRDPGQSLMDPAFLTNMGHNPEDNRRTQHHIQSASIWSSFLSTRMNIVRAYYSQHGIREGSSLSSSDSLSQNIVDKTTEESIEDASAQDAGTDSSNVEAFFAGERNSVVRDLLNVLGNMDQVNAEPNGDAFVAKLRSIAMTLTEVPDQRGGPIATLVHDSLVNFLATLTSLERGVQDNGSGEQSGNPNGEPQLWAAIAACQAKFTHTDAFVGVS